MIKIESFKHAIRRLGSLKSQITSGSMLKTFCFSNGSLYFQHLEKILARALILNLVYLFVIFMLIKLIVLN